MIYFAGSHFLVYFQDPIYCVESNNEDNYYIMQADSQQIRRSLKKGIWTTGRTRIPVHCDMSFVAQTATAMNTVWKTIWDIPTRGMSDMLLYDAFCGIISDIEGNWINAAEVIIYRSQQRTCQEALWIIQPMSWTKISWQVNWSRPTDDRTWLFIMYTVSQENSQTCNRNCGNWILHSK